ncbi:DNA-binding protein [Pseudomonas tohonis]|uniref:DNA-binding protein n=1 Tax=Pseudomonas tohonis TaxID=2725477 RepID=UPI000419158E|nr:DNA-binding protein [Pseudomonas tohonis]
MATANKALTADQVKERFRQAGKTITAWAVENGYTRNEVYRVLNGQAKAHYGKAHDIAVKLGLKDQAAA